MIDVQALKRTAREHERMNDDTLEAVTEKWMEEALKRRPKDDTCEKAV